MLKSSKDLKVKQNNEILTVYVSIDRTKEQREKHKKLVEELKTKRRVTGQSNLVIRGEKIVQNFPKDQESRRVTWAALFE